MNFAEDITREDTYHTGLVKLKDAVRLRERMCGDLYWNALNEDCCKLANKLVLMQDSDKQEIAQILGKENFS
jgi:hypothetical protein